ncbi:MAG: hypothetical protein NVSMB12_11690 [Acidimicrobiales bacterium]
MWRRGRGSILAIVTAVAVGAALMSGPAERLGPTIRKATAVELEGDPAAAMAIARTPSGGGYWIVDADGRVQPFGDAPALGSAPSHLARPVVGIAETPTGRGYWLVAADGGIFSFGDAVFHGSTGAMQLNQPVVGMAATPTGLGYWLVAADGGIFSFGDAVFHGSTGAMQLNRPVVGMAQTSTGLGYWLVASDGGIFTFGDAVFKGSTGSTQLRAPITSMEPTAAGDGYWLVGTDGAIFPFGSATSAGDATGRIGFGPAVGLAPSPSGRGYWILSADGAVVAVGDAADHGGSAPPLRRPALPVGGRMLDVYDPSRPTPARGSVPGHSGRALPTLVYYPATANGGSTPAVPGPWPVIVFAHGFNRTPVDYGSLLQPLAAAGYVVAAPYLPGARSDTAGTPTEADLDLEPADLSVVLSAVLASASHGSWLAGVADPSKAAAAGHSDGAEAVAAMTLDTAYSDGRIQAGLVLAGGELPMAGGTYGARRNVPVFIGQGSADDINSPDDAIALFGDARMPRLYVSAPGGGHETSFLGSAAQPVAMRAAAVDFLDWVFGGGRPALARLAHDGDSPPLTAIQADLAG